MKKIMSVPLRVGAYPTTSKIGRLRLDGSDYNEVSSEFIFSEMRATLESALARDAAKELAGNRPYGHFGPFDAKYEGKPKSPIPTKYIPLESLKTNNGKAWREANRTGNIVMSDFKSGMIELNYKYGSEIIKPGSEAFFNLNAANEGLFKLSPQGNVIIGGWRYLSTPFRLYVALGREEIEGMSPFEEGWSDAKVVSEVNTAIHNREVDGALVTSVLAEANSGTIDALTAMAEAPETLKSMLEGAKTGLRMYNDARKRAFRLYNKAKGNSNKETLKKNSKELADALSNVWMNFRYNIMPNIYLIKDMQKTLLTQMRTYVRYRGTKNTIFPIGSIPGFTSGGEFSSVERILIKRKLDLNMVMPKFSHLVMTNIFVTSWELVPLSFVADWFVNVGDVIASTNFNPGVTQEGATYSWKNSGTINFVSTAQKSAVSVTLKSYRRDVISPSAYTGLTWKPELNLKRQLDALALSWGAFKRTVKS